MSTVRHSDAINGVRGIAVLAVLAHHYFPMNFFSYNVGKLFTYLIIAVGGYFHAQLIVRNEKVFLSRSLKQRMTVSRDLIWRQFMRTWPLIVFVVIIYALLGAFDGGELTTQIFHTWWLYISGLGNVPKLLYGGQAFPSHFWASAAQDQTLAILAITLAFAGLERFRKLLPWIIGAGIVLRIVLCILLMPAYPAWALETPLSVVDIIALAMYTRFAIERKDLRGTVRRVTLTTAISLTIVWLVLPNTNAVFYGFTPLIITAVSMWLLLSVTDDRRANDRNNAILTNRAIVFLGRIGLSVFFLNPFVGTILNLTWFATTGSKMDWWLLPVLGTAVTIPCAWLMHTCLEKPLLVIRSRSRIPLRPATA